MVAFAHLVVCAVDRNARPGLPSDVSFTGTRFLHVGDSKQPKERSLSDPAADGASSISECFVVSGWCFSFFFVSP